MSFHRGPETKLVRFKEILIIDQDEAWALVMRDAVAGGGYCVVMATSVEDAVRRIRGVAPSLVMISCLMDASASETLFQEVEGLSQPPPVVLVGLLDTDQRWERWKGRPYVTAIRQPFKSRDVLEAVRTLLGASWEEPAAPPAGKPTAVEEGNRA